MGSVLLVEKAARLKAKVENSMRNSKKMEFVYEAELRT